MSVRSILCLQVANVIGGKIGDNLYGLDLWFVKSYQIKIVILTTSVPCSRDTEPALTHPHDLPYSSSNAHMEVLRYLRLQVFTVSPTDDLPYTCFETGTGPMQMCTAVISTSPQNSASVQLFMGGEAPTDAPCIECPKDAKTEGSLTVAVYQSDARIAHAIIPLSEVWQVCTCDC